MIHTIASVLMISRGGSVFVLTISDTKFAVKPAMQTMAKRARPLVSMKVLARGAAPYSGMAMLSVLVGYGVRERVERCSMSGRVYIMFGLPVVIEFVLRYQIDG